MGTANLRHHFADDRLHVVAGSIKLINGESSHFFVNDEKNVVVSVILHNHAVPVWANLHNTPGVWVIPDLDTEVLVASNNGDFEGELYVVGLFPPTNTQNAEIPEGLGPKTFNVVVTGDANIVVGPGSKISLISDTTVEAASSVGAGVSLAIQEAVHDIWRYLMNQFDPATGHKHPETGTTTSGPIESVIVGSGASVPEPSGTDILLGE